MDTRNLTVSDVTCDGESVSFQVTDVSEAYGSELAISLPQRLRYVNICQADWWAVPAGKQSQCASVTAPLRTRLAFNGLELSKLPRRNTHFCLLSARCVFPITTLHSPLEGYPRPKHASVSGYACSKMPIHRHDYCSGRTDWYPYS